MSGFIVRHESEVTAVPCPCGMSTRIVSARDGKPCSFHVTRIADSVRHYHRRTSEVYYILEGTGKMELDGEWHAIRPGSVVSIDSETRHRLVGDDGQTVTTIVVAIPPFSDGDEFFD